MFRASSLPGKPGRFRASDYLCSSEHTCIGCIAQIPMFRASNYLCSSEHMYWLHSPYPQVPSCTIFFLAWNTASMLCSEHCFFACFCARNTASSYALLGTLPPCLLLCPARNIASLPTSGLGTLLPPLLCSEHCFFACFCARNTASPYALLRTLLLCSARNIASLPASMLCSEHCFFACFYILLLVWIQLETLHISPLIVSLHSYLKKSKFRPKSRKNYINKQLPPISTSSNS